MGLKELGEGIILQALEDLFNEPLRADCIAFFRSRNFIACAHIAGLDAAGRIKLLNMVKNRINDGTKQFRPKKECQIRYKRIRGKLKRPAPALMA